MQGPIDFEVPKGFWIYPAGEYRLAEGLTLALCVPKNVDHRGLARAAGAIHPGDFLSGAGVVRFRVAASSKGGDYDRLTLLGVRSTPKGSLQPFERLVVIPFDDAKLAGRGEFALDPRIENRRPQWARFVSSVLIQARGTTAVGAADALGVQLWPTADWERKALAS